MAAKDLKSRFVREELQYARACLSLVRGDPGAARDALNPITRHSNLGRRHRVLGRAYEALGAWREAAAQYEEVLGKPQRNSLAPMRQALWVLDQHRLARVYDKLDDTDRARHWYERFTEDWKDADPDIPELIEARERLAELKTGEVATR